MRKKLLEKNIYLLTLGKQFCKTPQCCCELKNDATTAAINDPFSRGGRRKPTREQQH
jgi:hypothetical protein